LRKLELIIKERRLRWLGHVLRMEDSRIPRHAIQWELSRATRESRDDQGTTGWTMDIIRGDLKDFDEAEELATDRAEWRQRVAQCIH